MANDGVTIERSRHAQEFVIVGNREARDGRLSFRARGLHHHLLSLPSGCRVTTTQLGEENPEGREAIRTALNELVKLGYVTRAKYQDERGRWFTTMTVHDTPQDVTQCDGTVTATEDGFPGVGSPGVGFPGAKELKTDTKDEDQKMAQERASRRAQASGSRATERTAPEIITAVRKAVTDVYGEAEAEDLSDGEVLGLWATYARPKRPTRRSRRVTCTSR